MSRYRTAHPGWRAVAAAVGVIAAISASVVSPVAGYAAGVDELALTLNPAPYSGLAKGYTMQLNGTIRYAGPTSTGQVTGAQVRVTVNQLNTVTYLVTDAAVSVCYGPASTLTCALPPISRAGGSTYFITEVQGKTLGTMSVTATVLPPTADDLSNNTMSRTFAVVDGAQWKSLTSFRPPASVQNDVRTRPVPNECVQMQKIEDAYAREVNWDYYAIAIDRFPIQPGTTQPFMPAGFFSYVRQHLTSGTAANGWSGSLVDPQHSRFQPLSRRLASSYYAAHPARDDTWFTGSPVNSALGLDLGNGMDLAAIVTSDYSNSLSATSRWWTFYTLYGTCQIAVGYHPVSGARRFGMDRVGVGEDITHIFWTRGADQISNVGHWALRSSVYAGAHNAWLSLQLRINDFVNRNGGLSTIIGHTVVRVDWTSVCFEHWRPTVAWVDEPGRPVRDENKCGGGGG